MPGKVIHVSDDAHKAVTGYCKREGIKKPSQWASAVLIEAVNNMVLGKTTLVLARKSGAPLGREETRSDGPKPWELPPFWKKHGGKEKQEPQRSRAKAVAKEEREEREEQKDGEDGGDG